MWMPKEHLCVLVYLITATHSMQGGYLDKAQKYTDKALIQIEKLRSKYNLMYTSPLAFVNILHDINVKSFFNFFQYLNNNPF